MQSSVLIWLGVTLIVCGVMFSTWQALWRGRPISRERSPSATGLGLRSQWPSLVLIALGAIALLWPSHPH